MFDSPVRTIPAESESLCLWHRLGRLFYGFNRRETATGAASGRAPRMRSKGPGGKTGHGSEVDDRFVLRLLHDVDPGVAAAADQPDGLWHALRRKMALIPKGTVAIVQCTGMLAQVTIEAFCLDRCAVTNREYQRFVDDGGYENLEIWPRAVWPSLMKFVDRSGRPSPRDWSGGRFPATKDDLPVVGVCWHEASAYALWVGKRLPTAAEWQKAAGWPEDLAGGFGNRYPWGDIFAPDRANLGMTGIGRTVPVREFAHGATINGIHQLCGNVWEWLDDPLVAIPASPDETFAPWQPMRRIAGGAFDTYLPAEATCHFITGQPELDRRHNIGFRCAVSCDRLRPMP